jgi:uncharacterized membrane protein
MNDTQLRSITKTISWRITGSLSTFMISYLILGNMITASSIAGAQIAMNTLLYFIHERIWNRVEWQKL